MKIVAIILTVIVAVEHCYILWVEMFAWETAGKKIFGKSLPPEMFAPTRRMAANQGLYNGFLAAGLVWSLLIADPVWSFNVSVFFLCCVIIAALYGAFTAARGILLKQGLPAILALVFVLLAHFM